MRIGDFDGSAGSQKTDIIIMNVDLRYFSGTGNSYKIIDTCKEMFIQNGCKVTLCSIIDKIQINAEADLIGFCFPVYAFGIPRISKQYLLNLPKCRTRAKAFVLITAGAPDESGFAVQESTKILRKRGFDVVYSAVVHMPANWTVSMNPPSKAEAQLIINAGIETAKKYPQSSSAAFLFTINLIIRADIVNLVSTKIIIHSNGWGSAICGVISDRMKLVMHVNYVQKSARPTVSKL